MNNPFMKSLAALTVALVSASAQAAGLWLYEMGTPDVGTASAGMAARAQDAGTAFANPAGMTRLQGSQFMVGVQPIYTDIESDVDVATFGGGDGGNAGGFVPAGGLFYVHSLTQDLKFGLSAGSYLGLGVEFDNDWVGRYYILKEDFTTAFANGSVGYRVTDWLSVGAGVSFVYGELEYQAAVRNVLDGGGADGRLKFNDTDTDIGANAGLLIEPREGTRVGLTYISKVDFDFRDKNLITGAGPLLNAALQLSGLAGGTTKMKWTLPEQVMLGVHQELSDTLAIMGNLGWQNWSEFGKIGVSIDSTTSKSATVDANFDDTWHAALGARYRVSPVWSVSAGVAYDSSPVSNSHRSIALPLDRQVRYAVGAQYEWRKDMTLGVAFEYMDAGDAPVNQQGGPMRGNLKSDFKNDNIYFLALSMNWKF